MQKRQLIVNRLISKHRQVTLYADDISHKKHTHRRGLNSNSQTPLTLFLFWCLEITFHIFQYYSGLYLNLKILNFMMTEF